jgi:hypothetical protein
MCEGYLLINIYTGEKDLEPQHVNITEYAVDKYRVLMQDVRKLLQQAAISSLVNLYDYDIDEDLLRIENLGYVQIGDVYIEVRKIKS